MESVTSTQPAVRNTAHLGYVAAPSVGAQDYVGTSARRKTLALAVAGLYLSVITILLTVLSNVQLTQPNPWSIGDWLINYRGGFVRRGLPGEVARLLASALHTSPAMCVVSMQLALYGILLFCLWRLVRRSTCNFWLMAMLLSPATVAFPVLDVEGGFRKEVLLLAGLALLLVLLQRIKWSTAGIAAYVAVAAAILVLSHEAMIVFLPYWFAAVALALHSAKRAVLVLMPAAALVIAGWLLVVHHAGDATVASRICASLGSDGISYCSGAIAALAQTRAGAHADVLQVIASFSPVRLYVALALASLLPSMGLLATLGRNAQTRWQCRVVAGSALASVALSGPLFVYALDWGRWISIHAVCLLLVLLFVDGDVQRASDSAVGMRAWWYVPLLIFATTWGLPRMPGISPLRTRWIGYVYTLLR